jgi:hypothetical protein
MKKSRIFALLLLGVLMLLAAAQLLEVLMCIGLGPYAPERPLKVPSLYEPVGEELAILCQSDPSALGVDPDITMLPAGLTEVGYPEVSVSPDRGFVHCGGGFHHYGYKLIRESTDTTRHQNLWRLYLYSEGVGDTLLHEFRTDATRTLPREELMAKSLEGHDARIASSPGDPQLHLKKIAACLQWGEVEKAREAVAGMKQKTPDQWEAVLLSALVEARESFDTAERDMVAWVEQQENYFRYIDLATFYQLTNRPAKAAQAMIDSTRFSANLDWGHGCNSECRGFAVARYAFENGEHEAVKRLCDHLMKVTVNNGFLRTDLQALKAAAESAEAGRPTPLPPSQYAESPLFRELDLEVLLK